MHNGAASQVDPGFRYLEKCAVSSRSKRLIWAQRRVALMTVFPFKFPGLPFQRICSSFFNELQETFCLVCYYGFFERVHSVLH